MSAKTERAPRTFRDAEKQVWTLKVNVGSARRVKDETGVDILELARGKVDTLERIAHDEFLFGAVLYSICRPQADDRDLDEYGFAERLADADIISDAVAALLEALIDFFPRDRRPVMRRLVEKLDEKAAALANSTLREAETAIDSPELNDALDALIQSEFSTPVSNSPG